VATADVSQRNAEFWDELCGSHLARHVGIRGASPEELARFDAAYLDLYPYLLGYFPRELVERRRVLEVGLGYGTLAEALARMGADYHGLDIAAGPVEMARHRLAGVPGGRPEQVQQGSVLELPFPDASFDLVTHANMLPFFDELARVTAPDGHVVFAFSHGRDTPIYVPPERLRRELTQRGFGDFRELAAGDGEALVARRLQSR
jgi:SAM-dependent methyltransferase